MNYRESESRGCGVFCTKSWCDICRIVVPHITGQDSSMIESRQAVEEVRQELGHPESRPNMIWGSIRRTDSPEADWVTRTHPYDVIDRISGSPPPWEIEEGDIELMASGSVSEADTDRLRRLQKVVFCQTAATCAGQVEGSLSMASRSRSRIEGSANC